MLNMCVLRVIMSCNRLGLLIQTYLRLDRLDLAEKELKSLTELDADCTATQLATAWVFVAMVLSSTSQSLRH